MPNTDLYHEIWSCPQTQILWNQIITQVHFKLQVNIALGDIPSSGYVHRTVDKQTDKQREKTSRPSKTTQVRIKMVVCYIIIRWKNGQQYQ
ncbi:hypothetical protein GDO81_007702 [Engystomops pustulosus]|uniref:Uncharacterized protein n=1 Tax=Engystomops pustulosus TaxID=76066 RepID=A0AAV7C934_ENGPU|nr:hypothetical protein GDO81_007702 [Engystomops pustulosus]